MSAVFSPFYVAAKQWKRMVTKATFVGPGFTRKPPKYERFIRPSGLRFTKAHVTHPELKCTFNLEIIGVKKNPNGPMYTSLGVMTKGTIIEVIFASICSFMFIISTVIMLCGLLFVGSASLTFYFNFQVNVSELGLVTPAGKVVWGKYVCIVYSTVFIVTIILSAEVSLFSFLHLY